MIVYAIADLHGNLPPIPADAELLLIAGDICPDFRPMGNERSFVDTSGQKQSNWLDREFRAWLETSPCPVVATWGNHDFVGQRHFLVPDLPWTLLRDQETTAAGLRVWGTPWVPGLPYWAFYGAPEALQARADMIPDGLDVLMTHGPPWRLGDFIPTSAKQQSKYHNFTGQHVGDPTLNTAISRARPRTAICGHIHEAFGTYCADGIYVYNVSAVDENYKLHESAFCRLYEFA